MNGIGEKLLRVLETYAGTRKIAASEAEKMAAMARLKIHGTTILALKFKEGVIMAADRRCVAGEKIFSDKEIKIEETGSLSCIAGAGYVSDCQWLVKVLKQGFLPELEKFWELDEIFVDGQANLIDFIMENVFLLTWPILAGFDPFENNGRIFMFEPGGMLFKPDDYAAYGSGEDYALTVLDKEWSYDCSETKGIMIAIEALLASGKKDKNTSDSLLHPPLIKIITSCGIKDFPTEKFFKIALKERVKEEARKGIKVGLGTFIVGQFLQNLAKELEKK